VGVVAGCIVAALVAIDAVTGRDCISGSFGHNCLVSVAFLCPG
jgi:hypothetical protein